MNILIAEDDPLLRQGLADLLQRDGFTVTETADGAAAVQACEKTGPDLAILDIMMPIMDGYSACRAIRQKHPALPIIFLSAKSEEIDRVVGLELGADDYIVKPFGTREITARIRAVLRRSKPVEKQPSASTEFSMASLQIFPDEFRAQRGDETFDLSPRDIKILKLLADRAGKAVTRDDLFNHCWGHDHIPGSRSLDQHISQLRRKIEVDAADPRIICTVHGIGYRFPG